MKHAPNGASSGDGAGDCLAHGLAIDGPFGEGGGQILRTAVGVMARACEGATGASMTDPRWEHFPHQADVGLRGCGPTRETAFEQAALALTAAVCDPDIVRSTDRVDIDCEAEGEEMLLVAWLNALIYEMATRRMLFGHYRVHVANGCRLHAEAWGESVDVRRHQPAVEPKGATVTELRVAETAPGNWLAQCVVDV